MKPIIELNKAMYLGNVAEYSVCDSSVALPSSSSYRASILAYFPLEYDLNNSTTLGIVRKNTSIRAVKPVTTEGLGGGSIIKRKT